MCTQQCVCVCVSHIKRSSLENNIMSTFTHTFEDNIFVTHICLCVSASAHIVPHVCIIANFSFLNIYLLKKKTHKRDCKIRKKNHFLVCIRAHLFGRIKVIIFYVPGTLIHIYICERGTGLLIHMSSVYDYMVYLADTQTTSKL